MTEHIVFRHAPAMPPAPHTLIIRKALAIVRPPFRLDYGAGHHGLPHRMCTPHARYPATIEAVIRMSRRRRRTKGSN
jgi:hypothetical protein